MATSPPAAAHVEAPTGTGPAPGDRVAEDGAAGQQLAEEEVWEDDQTATRWALLTALPAWLISLVFHMLVLLVLAFITFSSETELKGVFVSASEVVQEDSLLEELTEIEIKPLEELEQTEEWSLAADGADPGAMAFGDLGALAEVETDADIGSINLPETTIDEIGSLFGKDGQGMSDIGEGLKAAASFFGTRSQGRKFVFVVDNSNSMTKGRFETALNELMMTIEAMSPQQQFYIIFFSDSAYRMFHPTPAPGLVPATESNKDKVRAWLYTVQMCLRTAGEEAVQAALALNPDVIYILGDGAFTDRTTQILTAPHNRTIPIHTVGMEVDPVGEKQLKAIADANNGKYRLVSALPAARLMAQRNPIPRNVTRGPVWGLKLPLVDGRKKKKK